MGGGPVLGRCPEEVFASYGEGSVGFEGEDDEVVGLELEVLFLWVQGEDVTIKCSGLNLLVKWVTLVWTDYLSFSYTPCLF